MSLDLAAIKTALAAQIGAYFTAGGGRETNVRPYRRVSTFPCITMTVTDITYFETMGPNGLAEVALTVTIHTNSSDPDSDEIAMSAYLSVGTGNPSSIADAINSSVTLGGVVESCVCLEVGAPHDTETDYAADFPLKIKTRKAGAKV